MSNIITSQIRADREYQQLSELARQNFGMAGEGRTVEDAYPYGKNAEAGEPRKILPILANGLCAGAADALTVSIIEDTASVRGAGSAPILVGEGSPLPPSNTAGKRGKNAGEGRTVEDACPYGTPSVIFLRKCHLPREGG